MGSIPFLVEAFHARQNKREMVLFLIKKGANVDYIDEEGLSIYFYAVDAGENDLAQIIAENAKDKSLPYAAINLFPAARRGNIDLIREILIRGVDPNVVDDTESTPLMDAVYHGKVEIVRLLMKYGADPNRKNKFGDSAVTLAKGNNRLLKILRGE